MKWIDVNDDLPPKGVRVLGNVQFKEDGPIILTDVMFDPSQGWESCGYSNKLHSVYHWHPLSTEPPVIERKEISILDSLEAFRAACEKLDESQ